MIGIAADVNMGALFQPGIDFLSLLAEAILHIDLLGLVAGESHVEAGQHTLLQPVLPLGLVEEVVPEVALAEEQPAAAIDALCLTLLEKGAERGDASAGTNHDDRNV